MINNENFTLAELFEKAKNDPSWEEDYAQRIELVDGLLFQLIFSIT